MFHPRPFVLNYLRLQKQAWTVKWGHHCEAIFLGQCLYWSKQVQMGKWKPMVSMYSFFYCQTLWNILTPNTKKKENSSSKSGTIEAYFTRDRSKELTPLKENFSPFTKVLVPLPISTISSTSFTTAIKIDTSISSNMFIKTNDHFHFLFFYFTFVVLNLKFGPFSLIKDSKKKFLMNFGS